MDNKTMAMYKSVVYIFSNDDASLTTALIRTRVAISADDDTTEYTYTTEYGNCLLSVPQGWKPTAVCFFFFVFLKCFSGLEF